MFARISIKELKCRVCAAFAFNVGYFGFFPFSTKNDRTKGGELRVCRIVVMQLTLEGLDAKFPRWVPLPIAHLEEERCADRILEGAQIPAVHRIDREVFNAEARASEQRTKREPVPNNFREERLVAL